MAKPPTQPPTTDIPDATHNWAAFVAAGGTPHGDWALTNHILAAFNSSPAITAIEGWVIRPSDDYGREVRDHVRAVRRPGHAAPDVTVLGRVVLTGPVGVAKAVSP